MGYQGREGRKPRAWRESPGSTRRNVSTGHGIAGPPRQLGATSVPDMGSLRYVSTGHGVGAAYQSSVSYRAPRQPWYHHTRPQYQRRKVAARE
eukprot:1342127-Rhodomonas_salina.1